MPWVIPPWLALVEFLGLTTKEYDEHAFDKASMSTMTATPTTGMAATMAITTKVTSTAMVAVTTTTTTMTSTRTTTTTMMGRRQCDGNDDDGTTRMEGRRCDGDGLVSAVPRRQQSTYVDNLGRSRQERGTI